MERLDRRRFMAVAGAATVGSVAGSSVASAGRDDRRGWELSWDDHSMAAVADGIRTDDGYLLVGTVRDDGPATAGRAVKLGVDGDVQWDRRFVSEDQEATDGRLGPIPRDGLSTALPAADGDGFLLVGWTYYDGAAVFVARLFRVGPDGSVRWERSLGDLDGASSYSYLADGVRTDGGYLLCGIESPGIMLGGVGWVVSVADDGTVDWHERYPATDRDPEEAIRKDTFRTILETDGGYVLGGDFEPERSEPVSQGWLVGIDGAGDVRWEERFEGTAETTRIYDLEPADYGYLAVGASGDPATSPTDAFLYDHGVEGNGFVAAYDDAGERAWLEAVADTPLYCTATGSDGAVAGGDRDARGWVGSVVRTDFRSDEESGVRALCAAHDGTGDFLVAGHRPVGESYEGWSRLFAVDGDGSEPSPRHLAITGGDSQGPARRYEFEVTGGVEKSADAGPAPFDDDVVTADPDHEDAIDGSSVTGVVAGGVDAYRFTGSLASFSIEACDASDTRVWIDGDEHDPCAIGDSAASIDGETGVAAGEAGSPSSDADSSSRPDRETETRSSSGVSPWTDDSLLGGLAVAGGLAGSLAFAVSRRNRHDRR